MLVQYLVGLCALKWDSNAVEVDVTLGGMVPDEASGSSRDVDVTVKVNAADGVHGFKGYEVKHRGTALTVDDVDALVTKFNDMPSITHRGIVSTSGYSDTAITKANYHGVDLYQFKPWDKPMSEQFPDLAPMSGVPTDHIKMLALNLCWPVQSYWLGTNSPDFSIPSDGKLYGPDGKQHGEYKTFDDFREAMVLRSTGILIHSKPVLAKADPLIQAHHSTDRSPQLEEPQWDFAHTLDTAADDVYIIADDGNFYQVNDLTISGQVRWEVQMVVYTVLEKVPGGEVFAGAVVAASDVPGQMSAFIYPAQGRNLGVVPYFRLKKRHLNSIRELQIALGEA